MTKYESLPSGRRYTARRGKAATLAGNEYPLHQENSNMCKRVIGAKSDSAGGWFWEQDLSSCFPESLDDLGLHVP